MEDFADTTGVMMVVVDHRGELYALMVDAVGEVLALEVDACERLPANMNDTWRGLASGVYPLEGELLTILDVTNVIEQLVKGRAA